MSDAESKAEKEIKKAEAQLKRNALVLKIEFHRAMMVACREDSTSVSSFQLSPEQHEALIKQTGEANRREALKAGARFHKDLMEKYLGQFKADYPKLDADQCYDAREYWMVEVIHETDNFQPLADPVMAAKVDGMR